MTAIASAMVGILTGGAALAQPTLNPQGGSAGPEMDHSRMGGPQRQGQSPSGPAPTLNPQGGGNVEMDHRRMGGQHMGGPTPSMDTKGEGTSGAEMTHPGNPGTGHGHQQGRQQRR
ncbi:hypothetical protein [Roseicella aerolata]|uniref:Uncharacterized protein n=1 Tax=Roseicella aerolata TaxID=2883479 RepID=A0A9X1LAI7_9PROT|nr:hypothetical protein [Roseicella aerolata]MCB4824874.1 hypothetical protein [Roseicella aerolata]